MTTNLALLPYILSSKSIPPRQFLSSECAPPTRVLSSAFSLAIPPSEFICFPSSEDHHKLVTLQSASVAWISHLETSLSFCFNVPLFSQVKHSIASPLNGVPAPHPHMTALF